MHQMRDGTQTGAPGVYEDDLPPVGHRVFTWVDADGCAVMLFARADKAERVAAALRQLHDEDTVGTPTAAPIVGRPSLTLEQGGRARRRLRAH